MFKYIPGFIKDADEAYNDLSMNLDWVRRDNTPRLEYYANQVGVPYTYGSGRGIRTYEVQPWYSRIQSINALLKSETGVDFEVCFLNRYLNQSDHLGWHSDDSPEMDDERPIAIISLGVEREIWFRKIAEPEEITKLKLGHGSLCLMLPHMQEEYQHRIPKAGFVCGERISMTYRGYTDKGE